MGRVRQFYPRWLIAMLDAAYCCQDPLSPHSLADRSNALSCTPLLIISAGRSGTTLLRSMLVMGGQIAIPPESYVFSKAVWKFARLRYFGWQFVSREIVSLFEDHPTLRLWEMEWLDAHERAQAISVGNRSLAKIIDEVFLSYAAQHFPNADCWGDQTPINTLYLPWIRRVFPKARYLHMLRDGRDSIVSNVRSQGETLARATQRWRSSVREASTLQSALPADRFLEVRYEDLVQDPESKVQEICRFAKLRYMPKMLDYWNSPTTVEHRYQSHHANLSRPVFTASIGRWKQHLSAEQQRYVHAKVGGLLEQTGYSA
jgi:protein-tyrosine sulfotransferase